MMHRIPLTKQFLLFISVIVAGIMLILGAVVYPTFRKYESIRQDIFDAQQRVEKEHTSITRAKRTIESIEDIEASVATYDMAAVRVGSELSLIQELEALAETHGIDQTLSADFLPPSKKEEQGGFAGRYQFSFLNKGTYQQHVAYLQALEALQHYMIIDRVLLDGKIDTAGEAQISASFQATVYLVVEAT